MSLPFVVDVAIGLVLIYLILSLISSEIQEILATILQWRAAHLKKSIEILLMGDGGVESEYIRLAKQGKFQTPADIAEHSVSFLRDDDPNKPLIQSQIESQLLMLRGTAEARTEKIVKDLVAQGLLSNEATEAELQQWLRDALLVEELYQAKAVTQRIYNDPLIRNISQNAREGFEGLIRTVTRSLITTGRKNTTLDRGNEPSYIPSETFATTLLEILDIPKFTRRLTALNLKILVQDQIISDLEDAVKRYQSQGRSQELNKLIEAGFKKFNDKLRVVLKAFVDQRISLELCIALIRGELVEYVTKAEAIHKKLTAASQDHRTRSITQEDIEAFDEFMNQLISIRQLVFYEDSQGEYQNSDELIRQLQPSVAQVMKAFRGGLQDVNQRYQRFTERGILRNNAVQPGYQEIITLYDEIRQDAQQIAQMLPFSVRASLDALSDRAQINLAQSKTEVQHTQDELYQFKTEIEKWFDRSMDRASGVYKRNAKGVGFFIGFAIALAINADTIHIAQRLASSTTLRQALVSSAETITDSCPSPPVQTDSPPASAPAVPVTPPETPTSWLFGQPAYAQDAPIQPNPSPSPATASDVLDCIEQAVGDVTSLPLGWGEENRSQQMNLDDRGNPIDPTVQAQLWYRFKRAIGWIVSGLALSMGAAFWFELLNKLVNVRNTGKRPDDRSST